jgi:hypothetical protein
VDLIFESATACQKKRTEQIRSCSPIGHLARDHLSVANGTPETLMEESKGQSTLDYGESSYSGGPILFDNVRIPNITMNSLSPPPGTRLDKPSLQLKQ